MIEGLFEGVYDNATAYQPGDGVTTVVRFIFFIRHTRNTLLTQHTGLSSLMVSSGRHATTLRPTRKATW